MPGRRAPRKVPASRPKHPYHEKHLDCFARRCILALGLAIHAAAFEAMFGGDTHWASGCSGTECPAFVFAALALALSQAGIRVGDFIHDFSAEMNPDKRDFIRQVHGGHIIFGDLFDVSRKRAIDTVSGACVELSRFAGLGLLIVGFSCKGASSLNTVMLADKEVHNIIKEMVSTTGLTFWATLLAIDRLRPRCFILENVMGLLRNGAAESVAAALRAKGYIVAMVNLTPALFGFPNSRPRLFFLGLRIDCCNRQSAARVERMITDAVWAQAENQQQLTVDDVILAEDSEIIKERREKMTQALLAEKKRKAGEKVVMAKWPSKHRKLNIVSPSCRWSAETHAEICPEYGLLPARQQEMLDHLGINFPDARPTVVGISQTNVSHGKENCAPTITPTGDFWIAHRGRRLIGQECLNMQGIFLPQEVADTFSDALLHDLAGNSFNTWNVLPCVMALFFTMSQLASQKAKQPDWLGMIEE